MRGLTLFIADIRKCRCKDDEIKRINKELANIRNKFRGDKPLNGYDKKKYVCKLIFMFLLGYKTDIGHIEAVNLLSSNACSEKQIGYLFISVVMSGDNTFMTLVINTLRNDLKCCNQIFQNLALQFISNNANSDMSRILGHEVYDILVASDTSVIVKQTAALTLLQLFRITPDLVRYKQYSTCLVHFLSHFNLGLVTAAASLLEWLAGKFPSEFHSCVNPAVSKLHRIVNTSSEDFRDYTYYNVGVPWLVVKLLRLLQKFPFPSELSVKIKFLESLEMIMNKAKEPLLSQRFEHNNARFAVIFEAIYTIIQMNVDGLLLTRAIGILDTTLKHKEPNLRFIALDIMTQLSTKEDSKENVKNHWDSILNTLQTETDITIKKRAVDLLYNICDKNNVKEIVEEMLFFLKAEDESVHEDVVLKSAILAEQFSTDLKWYVDTIFTILQIRGEHASDKVWFKLVKVVIDNDTVHEYAARIAFAALKQRMCNDNVINAAGYLLGEFGHLITKDGLRGQLEQLNIIYEKYFSCCVATRSLLLTTFMKFLNSYPDLKEKVQSIFRDERNIQSENVELQQRALEYLMLSEVASKGLLTSVLEEMPSCKRQECVLLKALEERKKENFNASSSKMIYRGKSLNFSCSNLNISPYVNPERNEISRFTSCLDVHRDGRPSTVDLLVDIFGETSMSSYGPMFSEKTNHQMLQIQPMTPIPSLSLVSPMPPSKVQQISTAPSNEKFINNLLFNESGTLFEDMLLKIEITCIFEKHYGRFHLTYKNKSSRAISNLTIQGNFANLHNKCSIRFKPGSVVVSGHQSMEQIIQLECLTEINARPLLSLKHTHEDARKEIKLILPLTQNKFSEPSIMSPDVFSTRWHNFGCHGQEVAKDFLAKYPMIHSVTRNKLAGFRLAIIEDVEEELQHFHCAAIFYSRSNKLGFLVKLEEYPEGNRYRCIVRSSKKSLAQSITNLLDEIL